MKCLVLFFISLGLAMSFPSPSQRDAEDLENHMTETELEEPGRRQMHFGNTAGNVGQQGINSGNVAVGNQWNGGHGGYGGHYNYGRGETELEEPGKRQMYFGNTAGSVGQQGTNSGNVAVGHQWNGKRQMYFGNTAGNVGQQGTNSGNVAVGHQWNGKRQMHFGNTAGNVGQQGTNSGNVAVGHQWNGRK